MRKIASHLLIILIFIQHAAAAGGGGGGWRQCEGSDLSITQSRTGRVVEGKPEYEVVVDNRCPCAVSHVVVGCYGMSSVEAVDPAAVRPVDGQRCVLHAGRSIHPGTPLRFNYAWMTPQDFPVLRITQPPNCS